AELAVGEAAFCALAARRTIAAVELRTVAPLEFRSIPTRLEIPFLATPAVVAIKPRRTRPVAIVAAWPVVVAAARRGALAIAAKAAFVAIALVEAALGEFLVAKAARAALAACGAITPAARGIVVFVAVTGHKRSHFDGSNGGGRARHEALRLRKTGIHFC